MANIWEYIANYNPTGFYEDNRAKGLQNDLTNIKISAASRANEREAKIMALQDALDKGDKSALRSLGIYSPETTHQYITNEKEMLDTVRPMAQAILKMAPENRQKGYEQMLAALPYYKVDGSDMPRQYDEATIEFLANSDPQKLMDERRAEITEARDRLLDSQTKENNTIAFGRDLQKMQMQHNLNEQANDNQMRRDLQKVQYAYDRADNQTKRNIDFITQQLSEGNIDGRTALTAAAEQLGVKLDMPTGAEKLQEEYLNENTTPERRAEILSLLKGYNNATTTKSSRTPAQELKDLYGAGYSPESIKTYSQTGNIEDLQARPNQGSIAADIQKYNTYVDEKQKAENQAGRPLTEEEDVKLQGLIGIDGLSVLRAKAAELDRQYKALQAQKILAELPFVGKTTSEKEADRLVKENPDLSYEEAFGIANKNKGTNVTVNNGEGQSAFDKEMGKKDANVVAKNEEDITDIENQLPILDQMKIAVLDPNLYQGTGGEAINSFKTSIASFMRLSGASDKEIEKIKGLNSSSILNTGSAMLKGRLRKDLMPGPLSDRDLNFLIAMTPSLSKTKEQNAAIINMYQKVYKRQLELLRFTNDYARKNHTLDGWKEASEKAGLDRAIFTEEEKAFVKKGRKEAEAYSPPKTAGSIRGGKLLWRKAND